jgi:hypothetical protein
VKEQAVYVTDLQHLLPVHFVYYKYICYHMCQSVLFVQLVYIDSVLYNLSTNEKEKRKKKKSI